MEKIRIIDVRCSFQRAILIETPSNILHYFIMDREFLGIKKRSAVFLRYFTTVYRGGRQESCKLDYVVLFTKLKVLHIFPVNNTFHIVNSQRQRNFRYGEAKEKE